MLKLGNINFTNLNLQKCCDRFLKEVSNMLIAEYSYETDLKVHMNEAREEGKIEGKIEIAKNMLNDGMSVELISKYTGISIEKVEEIL